jgi:predicted membrane protein
MDKSLLRHILTALGSVLAFIGLSQFTGLVTLLSQNLDAVWAAVSTLIGVATAIIGFFKGKENSPL